MDPSDKGSWVGRSFLKSLLGSADVVVIGGHVTVVVVSTSGKKTICNLNSEISASTFLAG